jgi:glc operon protein GlcG
MALNLAEANRAIDAALAKARDLQAKIGVTVCDSGGHLIAHQRMDGMFAEAY